MPTDLTVILRDRPGELARLGEVMGAGGMNIRGLAAFTGEGRGVIHLLVDDEVSSRAFEELKGAGIGVADEREVLVVDVADRPGSLGELAPRRPTSTSISPTRPSAASRSSSRPYDLDNASVE